MRRNASGFTLIEMTIVFVIMALVMTAGVSALSAQVESSRQATTRKNQETIRQALTTFISRNNRLPCPAVRTLPPGAVGYGVEASNPGTCTGTVSTGAPNAVVTGIVPFVSLGLSSEAATDGHFNRFTYQVVLAATNAAGPQTVSGMRGFITVHSAGPGVAGLAPAGNQTNFCQVGGYNPCAAVAVIVSHGRNGFGAFTTGGTQIQAPIGVDELANADDDARFVRKDFSDNQANPFDDVVLALTTDDLLSPLTQHGVLMDSKASLNVAFGTMREAVEAAAIRGRVAGLIQGQASFPIIPPPNITDPWGGLIVFSPGVALVTASTPAGTAFTMTSAGPDGLTPSADDISASVSVSELQSLFARTGF